jgi:hypothetical protein
MTRILLSFPTSSPFIAVADCCSNLNPRNQNEKDLSPLLKDMREFSLGLGLHHDEDNSPAFLNCQLHAQPQTLGALPLSFLTSFLLGYASIKMPSTTMLQVGIQRWRMRSNDKQHGFEQRRVERVAFLIMEGRGRLCTGGCGGQQSLLRSGWLGSRSVDWKPHTTFI